MWYLFLSAQFACKSTTSVSMVTKTMLLANTCFGGALVVGYSSFKSRSRIPEYHFNVWDSGECLSTPKGTRQTFATQLAIIFIMSEDPPKPQNTSKDAQANFENLPGHHFRNVGNSGSSSISSREAQAKVRNIAGHHFRNVEEPSSVRYDTQNMGITILIFFGAHSWA